MFFPNLWTIHRCKSVGLCIHVPRTTQNYKMLQDWSRSLIRFTIFPKGRAEGSGTFSRAARSCIMTSIGAKGINHMTGPLIRWIVNSSLIDIIFIYTYCVWYPISIYTNELPKNPQLQWSPCLVPSFDMDAIALKVELPMIHYLRKCQGGGQWGFAWW